MPERRHVAAAGIDRHRGQRAIVAECERPARLQGIAIAPFDARHVPTGTGLFHCIDAQAHRRGRQRDIGVAGEELATAQIAIECQQGARGGGAVVDAQIATEVLTGDRRVHGFQAEATHLQRPADPQRPVRGCFDRERCIEQPALQARFRPRLRQQRLRPGHRHAGKVERGQVRRGGAAIQCEARATLRQRGLRGRGIELHGQPQGRGVARTQHAIALPTVVGHAPQRAAPMQVAIAVAQARRLDLARPQLQFARAGTFWPVQSHPHLFQGGDRRADPGDARLRHARMHGHGGEHRQHGTSR